MEAVPRGPDTDVDTRLRSMVTDFLRFVRRKRGAYVALVRGASGGDPKVLAALDEVRSAHALRWLEAAGWPARDELTTIAVRGWLGSLEEVALAASTSPVPRSDVVDLLVGGLQADLARAELIGAPGGGADTRQPPDGAGGRAVVGADDRGLGG
jgi:hypothetical protein